MAKKKEVKGNPERTKFLIQLVWLFLLGGILIAGCTFLYISKRLLPDTEELENPKYKIASSVLAADGSELGKEYTENRVWIPFEELNPHVVNALISTEDERYYQHSGIDSRSLLRAVVFMSTKGGASTITQQLAKQFFTQRSNTFVKRVWQKLKEWVIAVQFEKQYTKEEIIAMYLNKFDYYYNAVGIGTAAKTYYGKDQKDLEPDEAAMLIGMLKNPYLYNPKANPENAQRRKSVVLKQMEKAHHLSRDQYEEYSSKQLDLSGFKREDYYDGPAPYFRAELIKWVRELLNADQYKKPDGSKYSIYTDGLKIYTTINPRIQAHAEASMKEHMTELQKKYFNRWEKKDPWSYNTTKEQKEQRMAILASAMRSSDRFVGMKQKAMAEVSKKIYDKIPDSRLLDGDIFRLFDAEKDEKYLDDLIKRKMISDDQKSTYNQILKSEYWPELKAAWTKLRKDADVVFNKPIKMMVFDYSESGEKEVTMSPLDSIRYHQQHLQLGSVAIDPKTGYVLSWVGGIGHKYFQFDHVRSNRQVGSTFKPFIYGTAIIEQGWSPCQKVQDLEYCILAGDPNFKLLKTWCPPNSDNKFTGDWLTLREGLKQSKNSVSVYLMKEIGNAELIQNFVGELGIDRNKVPAVPSICLGVPELSAMDMATAYTAFANNGVLSKPIFVTRIEDKNGRVIYSAIPEQKKTINPSYNYVIVDMLKYVANILKSKGVKSEVGGKTGTTNDYKDGWFVGFTPEIVVSTWVGGDMEWIRFLNLTDGQGATMARPFFEKLLKKIEADDLIDYNVAAQFEIPEEKIVIDCSRYEELNKSFNNQNTPSSSNSGEEFEPEF